MFYKQKSAEFGGSLPELITAVVVIAFGFSGIFLLINNIARTGIEPEIADTSLSLADAALVYGKNQLQIGRPCGKDSNAPFDCEVEVKPEDIVGKELVSALFLKNYKVILNYKHQSKFLFDNDAIIITATVKYPAIINVTLSAFAPWKHKI